MRFILCVILGLLSFGGPAMAQNKTGAGVCIMSLTQNDGTVLKINVDYITAYRFNKSSGSTIISVVGQEFAVKESTDQISKKIMDCNKP